MRVIYVKRCAIDECPYCKPHKMGKLNQCTALRIPYDIISAKLKTFPNHCPLQDFSTRRK